MGNENKTKSKQKNPLSAVLSILSSLLLAVLVLACIPLTLPRLFGYQIYSVISGSMEPAIPTGSLVFIMEGAPEDAQTDDVIAFYGAMDSASIITHRVVENRVFMGELITKGDANQVNDINPVPYANYIGKVVYSVPVAGRVAEILTSDTGKILAAGLIGAAVLLQGVAALLDRKRQTI